MMTWDNKARLIDETGRIVGLVLHEYPYTSWDAAAVRPDATSPRVFGEYASEAAAKAAVELRLKSGAL